MRATILSIFILGIFPSCRDKPSAYEQAEIDRQERKDKQDAEIERLLRKYGGGKKIDEIKWHSKWLIEKQNYFLDKGEQIFYVVEHPSSLNVMRTQDNRIAVTSGDFEWDDFQVRVTGGRQGQFLFMFGEDDASYSDQWLLAFKVKNVAQAAFQVGSSVEGVDYIVEKEDLGSEVFSEVYLTSKTAAVFIGELIEFKKLGD